MYRIAVTNRHLCEGDFLTRVARLAEGKYYQAILLREKDLSEDEYEKLTKEVLAICQRRGKKCILHSFPGTALRLGHPYVHMPLPLWESLKDEEKNRLQQHMIEIGTSIHSMEQLRQAEALGASYVMAGHIFATDSKKGIEPRGLDFLSAICQASNLPVYGIGGIHPGNEKQVMEMGASGVCMMSSCMKEDQ